MIKSHLKNIYFIFFLVAFFIITATPTHATITDSTYLYGSQTNCSYAGYSIMSWTNELYDITNLHSTSSSSTKIFIATAGYYQINAGVSFGNYTDRAGIQILINNTIVSNSTARVYSDASAYSNQSTSFTKKLEVGDYVEAGCYGYDYTPTNTVDTYLSLIRLDQESSATATTSSTTTTTTEPTDLTGLYIGLAIFIFLTSFKLVKDL